MTVVRLLLLAAGGLARGREADGEEDVFEGGLLLDVLDLAGGSGS